MVCFSAKTPHEKILTEKIKATEKIRIDITKETDPVKKLDLALLCIYFLAGDVAFYNTNINQINKYAS